MHTGAFTVTSRPGYLAARRANLTAGTLSHAGLLAAGLAWVLCLAAGCGSVSTDAGGAGGVITLGPRPVGGDAPGTDDQADNGDVPADGDENTNGVGQDDAGPVGDGGGSDTSDAGDSADDVSDAASGDNDDHSGDFDDIDACAAVSGQAFFWPNSATRTGSLSFVEGTFIWTVGGVQAQGTFECAGLDITGFSNGGDVFTGGYHPVNGTVLWEGSIYRPAETWR